MKRMLSLLPVAVSMAILITVTAYYVQFAQREYYAINLKALDEIFVRSYKKAKTPEEKNKLAAEFAPVFSSLTKKIERLHGSWKKMHTVYQNLARTAMFQRHAMDAAYFLKKSLHYHPYYPNAYEMLGYIYKLLGQQKKERACKRVAKAIFSGSPPNPTDMDLCRK